MANLFFIHTPLQLLVAQQIIRQEKLQDNVMLYGYVDDNVHFLDIYDLTIIEEMWYAKVPFPQVACWAIIYRKHVLRDGKTTFRNYKFIQKVINKYKIDTLYLGDMENISCLLAAMSFHRIGLNICFFEEGSGHYVMNYGYGEGGSFLDKIYAVCIDVLYYWPVFGVRFGLVIYWKGYTLKDIPMDVRYSLVPFYHENFDRLIQYQPLLSDKLKTYLAKQTEQVETTQCVLLLTSPFYINGVDDNPEPYVKTIVDFAKTLDAGICLHMKFHPRETMYVRESIIQNLTKEGICFLVLDVDMGIPVEYYLQYVHYDKIVMFYCSTYFYNGYLFPKMKFVSILRSYYNNCKAAASISEKYLEPLLKEIPEE